jgi:hypothetical protein
MQLVIKGPGVSLNKNFMEFSELRQPNIVGLICYEVNKCQLNLKDEKTYNE